MANVFTNQLIFALKEHVIRSDNELLIKIKEEFQQRLVKSPYTNPIPTMFCLVFNGGVL